MKTFFSWFLTSDDLEWPSNYIICLCLIKFKLFLIYFRDFWPSVTSTDLETRLFWNDKIEIWPLFRICNRLWPLVVSRLFSLESLRQERYCDIKFSHSQSKYYPKWAEICTICNLTLNLNFLTRNYFQIPLIILNYCLLKFVKSLICKN